MRLSPVAAGRCKFFEIKERGEAGFALFCTKLHQIAVFLTKARNTLTHSPGVRSTRQGRLRKAAEGYGR
jgi:hypothetical protein